MRQLFLVYQQHGGPWDWSKALREQGKFDEHARFMDALVDEGFIVLGGPLDERDVLLAVRADTVASIRERLADDPWIANGMLSITDIRPWSILLERQYS
jgi:YCII-related domain-containing protein